eukprot:SAG31_NODE_35844_length_319_cov_0.881818_1_plen_83_part_01
MEVLNIKGYMLSGTGAVQLVQQLAKLHCQLRILNLAENNLNCDNSGQGGIECVCKLMRAHQQWLTNLDLSNNPIGPQGCLQLA